MPVRTENTQRNGIAVAPAPTDRQRLHWLDVTRGVAIAGVVAFHTLGSLEIGSTFNGQGGVDTFLLLSGFGLAYATRPETWYSFLARRLAKLLPAYWIVLAAFVAINYYRVGEFSLKQVLLSATCLHLIAGDPYGFAINMSFWFMGLIVPLYVCFALLRRWLFGERAYAVLGIATLVAWTGGVLLVEYGAAWGPSSISHAPGRFPLFFLGAIAGIAYRRGEGFARLTKEPWVLAALVALLPLSSTANWTMFPFGLVIGTGFVLIGMLLASLGQRWRLFKPLMIGLTALGAIAYELYLCHQYILLSANVVLEKPWVVQRFASFTADGLRLLATFVALALSVWLAYGLRWIVNWKESRQAWKSTLASVVVISTTLVVTGVAVSAHTPKLRTRAFKVAVELPPEPIRLPVSEPIVCFGYPNGGDLVFLQHDGQGQSRIGIDHFGFPGVHSAWVKSEVLTAEPWQISINVSSLTVRAAGIELRHSRPPSVPNARPVVGHNPFGFGTASELPVSTVERVRKMATTAPAANANER